MALARTDGKSGSTKAQEWARKRNWAKALVKNAHATFFRTQVFTKHECSTVDRIIADIETLLYDWETQNEDSKATFTKGDG